MKMKQILFVITLFVVITGVLGSKVEVLNSVNFESSIKEGTWFIKFFSPWCPHCQNFAPIWTKVAVENGGYIDSKNFHIAEVDCTIDGDLCEQNGVKSYPQLNLFNKGKNVEMYKGSKTFDEITKYVESKTDEYYIPNDESGLPNPRGIVVSLTSTNFDKLTSSGIWFIKFFAPWCTHCQRLAPIWEELGHKLQNRVNVGKVDCTAYKDLCQRFNVQGYPTLKLLNGPNDIIEYKSSRQLNSLRDFAERAADARVTEIGVKDLDGIKKSEEVFFIYLYDDSTPVKINDMIRKLSRSFFTVKFYSSKDSNLAARLKVNQYPSLIVIKDVLQKKYPSTSMDSFSNYKDIKRWIQSEKYPLVPAMDSENYEDVLGGDRLVVLGVFSPLEGSQFNKVKENLENIARLYYQQINERDGSEDGRKVIFAWLDGVRWIEYINGVYGLTKNDIPTVLIADPVSNEYFDTARTGDKLTLSNEKQLLESIHDAKRGYLDGKSTMGFIEKTFRELYIMGGNAQQSIFNHPVISLIIIVLLFGAIYRYCIAPQTRSVRDYERGYDKFE